MPSTSFVASIFSRNRRELLHVEEVDLGDLRDHLRLVLVVREVVVALGDADLGKGAVAAFVREQEGRDAGRVGLESEQHHVVHQLECIPRSSPGMPAGVGTGRVRDFAKLLGLLDALLDLADAERDTRRACACRVASARRCSARASSSTKSRIERCCACRR